MEVKHIIDITSDIRNIREDSGAVALEVNGCLPEVPTFRVRLAAERSCDCCVMFMWSVSVLIGHQPSRYVTRLNQFWWTLGCPTQSNFGHDSEPRSVGIIITLLYNILLHQIDVSGRHVYLINYLHRHILITNPKGYNAEHQEAHVSGCRDAKCPSRANCQYWYYCQPGYTVYEWTIRAKYTVLPIILCTVLNHPTTSNLLPIMSQPSNYPK